MIYYSVIDISAVDDCYVLNSGKELEKHFKDISSFGRKESICARALLRYILNSKYGLYDFFVDNDFNGKPYIADSDIFFNISHSGNYVLCAVGNESVGCDIEIINKYNEKVAERFFTASEQNVLKNSENKSADFIRLWTLKESVLKLTGVGVGGELLNYNFSEHINKDEFEAFDCNFKVIQTDDSVISICAKTNSIVQLKADAEDIFKVKGDYHEYN